MRLLPLKSPNPSLSRPSERAATLIEIMIAGSIGTLVVGSLMATIITMSREHRRSMADMILQQQAAHLQDNLSRVLRSMSATESVSFGNPTAAGSTMYRRIVVARGAAAANFPREEIYFDTGTSKLMHDTNRNVAGTDLPVHDIDPTVALKNVYFFASLKPGGAPDASMLNVYVEMDDNGAADRKNPDGTVKNTVIRRTFSVKMRNP